MTHIRRRSFLRAALAAAAAPMIVPAHVLGRGGGVAPSERIVMGAIGHGNQGARMLENFLARPEARVVAVCDVNPPRLAAAKAAVDAAYGDGACAVHTRHEDLLGRGDLDAVLIATGDRWHAWLSILAARAGLDVYCEKPMSMTIAEARAVAAEVARTGIVYQSGTQRRNVAHFAFAAGLARSGKLGRLRTLHGAVSAYVAGRALAPQPVPEGLDWDRWLGPSPWRPYDPDFLKTLWRHHLDYAGGRATDWGVHTCDLARWALNPGDGPLKVEGRAEWPAKGFCDAPVSLTAEAVYAGGAKITMESVKDPAVWPVVNGELAVLFEGDEGWAYADDSGLALTKPASLLAGRAFAATSWQDLGNWDGHHADFLRCVRTRRPPTCPAALAADVVTVCHAVNLSLRLGRPLRWDPAAGEFDDAQANRMLARSARAPWGV